MTRSHKFLFAAGRPTGVGDRFSIVENQLVRGEQATQKLQETFQAQIDRFTPDLLTFGGQDGSVSDGGIDFKSVPFPDDKGIADFFGGSMPSPVIEHPEDWPIRDQGGTRGTCTAFNFVAAIEVLNAQSKHGSPHTHFSEEFLYSRMRRNLDRLAPPFKETGATFIQQAILAYYNFGMCPREFLGPQGPKSHPAWSVLDTRQAGEEAKKADVPIFDFHFWQPSREQAFDGLPEEFNLLPLVVSAFRAPACISLPIYPDGDITQWTYGVGWDTGVIPEPDALREKSDLSDISGHSVCIVGYVDDDDAPGGGWYIFRNSWGEGFGARRTKNPILADILRPGYGALSKRHVHTHSWEIALTLKVAQE